MLPRKPSTVAISDRRWCGNRRTVLQRSCYARHAITV